MNALRAAALATTLLFTACGSQASSTTDPSALSSGAAVKSLDAGKVDNLPTGGVFVKVIQFVQPSGYVITSKQHVPGVVYVESGVHRLTLEGQPPIDLAAGQAKFHLSITHTHFNPGTGSSTWYFIALWSSSSRGQPSVDPIARPVFQSENFSPEQLPQGAYSEVLRHVTLAGSGRSQAHKFGGLAVFFVLHGSLVIRSSQGSVTLGADQGAVYTAGVPLQEVNAAAVQTVYLEMLTTAFGREFEVPLSQSPKG